MDSINSELDPQRLQQPDNINAIQSIFAFLGVGVLGSIVFAVLPLIVGAITDHLPFSGKQVGVSALMFF
jgi:hypothetical protein